MAELQIVFDDAEKVMAQAVAATNAAKEQGRREVGRLVQQVNALEKEARRQFAVLLKHALQREGVEAPEGVEPSIEQVEMPAEKDGEKPTKALALVWREPEAEPEAPKKVTTKKKAAKKKRRRKKKAG